MKPSKVIPHRRQSPPAQCPCTAEIVLEIKEPKIWSYQERIIERCAAGHILHGQAVIPEPPMTLHDDLDDEHLSDWRTW